MQRRQTEVSRASPKCALLGQRDHAPSFVCALDYGRTIGISPDIALGNSLAPNRNPPHRLLVQTNGLDLLSRSLGSMADISLCLWARRCPKPGDTSLALF